MVVMANMGRCYAFALYRLGYSDGTEDGFPRRDPSFHSVRATRKPAPPPAALHVLLFIGDEKKLDNRFEKKNNNRNNYMQPKHIKLKLFVRTVLPPEGLEGENRRRFHFFRFFFQR